MAKVPPSSVEPLAGLAAPSRAWFAEALGEPTPIQRLAYPSLGGGRSSLLLAPTGSGKTLAAFLVALDRLMFGGAQGGAPPERGPGAVRVLYVSPLKALNADIERNLRAPLAGLARAAERLGVPSRPVRAGVRSGDTPAAERARMLRDPPEILITTPESLYLLLTSAARETLAGVETVIVDEIHTMVDTKRGAHLFLSLERLEALRVARAAGGALRPLQPLQRVGCSATVRPSGVVARLLGGLEGGAPRAVDVLEASALRPLELRVEMPPEPAPGEGIPKKTDKPQPIGAASGGIWPSLLPRLVAEVRGRRSTMIFTNSRRLSERVAQGMNDLAGEELALAHHGSVAKEQRAAIEDRLKRGDLRAIVATSSLELGIDMGTVDLVIQIEAPPSVAAGIQRVGRASHHVGGTPAGVIVPKYKGDLLAAAAVVPAMLRGEVEETRLLENPLDVLAQQIVAAVAVDDWAADELFALARRAAPCADLPRSAFDGVLDMLAGRYPSSDFSELRPRLVWDRAGDSGGVLRSKRGTKRLAVTSGGTIVDRGLYGVFLAGGDGGKGSRRVGELDEEMVFEARAGEVFVLGASAWRIEEITHDRVLVTPAPGQTGKMPFWRGDRVGRSAAFGGTIGALTRRVAEATPKEALRFLQAENKLDPVAAATLVNHVREQADATKEVPSDRAIVLELAPDELGDLRVVVLSPFGARVHAPWATAVRAKLSAEGLEVEGIHGDDGMVFRLPEEGYDVDPAIFFPSPAEVEELVVRSLSGTSVFAARFREAAFRALLLPRQRPDRRQPLWAQRKRAQDLLAVAARYPEFPMIVEAYRECLVDTFDLPALRDLLAAVEERRVKVVTVHSKTPSPFAASLLFGYVSAFLYEGDAPLAERRAQALSVDTSLLRELLGQAELRDLLDPEAILEVERGLQRLDEPSVRDEDELHEVLLRLGDLSASEIALRCVSPSMAGELVVALVRARRALSFSIAGETRFAAVEDAARLRDALGVVPPPGLPGALLAPAPQPMLDLVGRFARTHGPFVPSDVVRRLGLPLSSVEEALATLERAGRLLRGAFLREPAGRGETERCDPDVLGRIRRRSLHRYRKEAEPVSHGALSRFLLDWHDLVPIWSQGEAPRREAPHADDADLLRVVQRLEGAPLLLSELETAILPARLPGYRPGDLDSLAAQGELLWLGVEAVGEGDGRVALHLRTEEGLEAPARAEPARSLGPLHDALLRALSQRGASFFRDLARAAPSGSGSAVSGAFGPEVARALWDLVFEGAITNDTLAPLRSLHGPARADRRARERPGRLRALGTPRPMSPPGTEGRWSLVPRPEAARPEAAAGPGPAKERAQALARQRLRVVHALLERHGVLTREAVAAEGLQGGFPALYETLRAMDESGRARRGYYVEHLGAAQFAVPGAEERLRELRSPPREGARVHVLAATDPANAWGAALPWPEPRGAEGAGRPTRSGGARVVLLDGVLVGWLGRAERALLTFLPEDAEARERALVGLANGLARFAQRSGRKALLLERVDGEAARDHLLARALERVGFVPTSKGMFLRTRAVSSVVADAEREASEL